MNQTYTENSLTNHRTLKKTLYDWQSSHKIHLAKPFEKSLHALHCTFLPLTEQHTAVDAKTSFFTSRPFLKTAGGIVLGSVAVSAVSAVSADVLPYISVAIKASFLKLGMCNICKNNIAKMFLDFWKILNCSFDRRF